MFGVLEGLLSFCQCCGSEIRCFFDLGIQDGKKVRIRVSYPRSFFRELRNCFWVKNTLNSFMRIRIPDLFDLGSGMGNFGSDI
jgi:hypothetical protein